MLAGYRTIAESMKRNNKDAPEVAESSAVASCIASNTKFRSRNESARHFSSGEVIRASRFRTSLAT